MTRPTITTEPLEVTGTGHRTEFLYDDGDNDERLVCAAHGGRVEPGTAEQAIELAARLPSASCWACMAYDDAGEEFERFHPGSSEIDPAEYPLLAEVADRDFETVISLHGLADERLLVGGATDEAVKREVADHLAPAVDPPVETVADGPYGGVAPENFVNWLAADGGGLQLEQGPGIRYEESGAVVDGLAELVAEGVL